MSDDRPLDDVPDMAAAELALGLLEGDDRARALRRVLAEHGFAQEVERWRVHLGQLFDLWPGMAPPVDMLARIERTIDGPVAPPVPTPIKPSLLWPIAAGFSSVAAAAMLLFIVVRPTHPLPRPIPRTNPPVATAPAPSVMLVAAIAQANAGAPVTAIYDPRGGGLRLTAASLADANRSAELWVIAGDGVPHSLGLLRAAGTTAFKVSQDNRARLAAGVTLAISLEPIGGSPTGLPTGPVVAKGALSQV